ncbi:MAG: tetratricopeptide repeat protein, partial [Candidatus Sumerlaeia bacterium]|nr:tetratricopeptide repeat protein [Candidatus Sumerlaeia bacterium]
LVCFRQAQKVYPQNIDAIAAEADLLRQTNDFESATEVYKKWLKVEPFLLTIYNSLGYCYVKTGQYQLAYDLFKTGLQFNPKNPVLLNNIANLMLLMKNYTEAVKYYRLAAEVPNQFSKENRLNFARALLATQNFSEALLILRELYQEQPSDSSVMKLLAETELKLGNFASAREVFFRLLLLCPPDERQIYYQHWHQITYESEKRNGEKDKKE